MLSARTILYYLLALVVVPLGLALPLLNGQSVSFNYYFGQVQWPLAALIAAALGVGWLLGVVSMLASTLRLQQRLWKTRRELARQQRALDNQLQAMVEKQYQKAAPSSREPQALQ